MEQHYQHNTPQRLSALYQYHNAPELAPVSGLEYDDTIHDASSDKYPVVHHRHYESTIIGKVYDTNDRPPRIIFGMKVRTFLLVAAIMLLLIVGAAVGGALGGARRENHVQPDYSPANIETNSGSSSASSSTPTSAMSSSSSGYQPTIPTYTPLDACPDANNTLYTSSQADRASDSKAEKTAGLTFTRYCDVASPLDGNGNAKASMLSEAFVYSLDDCIELCASLNYWAGEAKCTVAAYDVKGSRHGNCWVGSAEGVAGVGDLEEKEGVAVALVLST